MNNKIALLFPYFGRLPNLFEFWLKTISYNKCIDIFLITDQPVTTNQSETVFTYNISFSSFVELVKSSFDYEIQLNNPYKICDFRPAFGNIFQDILKGYDFWGYGDLDVIWGDFETFINDELLYKYDRISQFGHLSLYRNCKEMNELYCYPLNGEVPCINAFTNKQNCTFDEWWDGQGIENIALSQNIKEFRDLKLADVSRIYKKKEMCFKFDMNCTVLPQNIDRVFLYSNGHLSSVLIEDHKKIVSTDEVIYAHFQKRKLCVTNWRENEDFWIVPNKILYGSQQEVIEYLKSDEYKNNYDGELIKFKVFREKNPDVF